VLKVRILDLGAEFVHAAKVHKLPTWPFIVTQLVIYHRPWQRAVMIRSPAVTDEWICSCMGKYISIMR